MRVNVFVDGKPVKYGRLTPLSEFKKDGALRLRCLCECGTEKVVRKEPVIQGLTRSCGCLASEVHAARMARIKTTHGMTKTKMFKVWCGLKSRCTNPKAAKWPLYGGRGIKFAAEWERFEPFRDHVLSILPAGSTDIPKGLQIDRKDNEGHYEPGNIRFVTRTVNNRNKRTNRWLTVGGVSRTVPEWAELYGINPREINRRCRNGWSDEAAVTTPMRLVRGRNKYPGVNL